MIGFWEFLFKIKNVLVSNCKIFDERKKKIVGCRRRDSYIFLRMCLLVRFYILVDGLKFMCR